MLLQMRDTLYEGSWADFTSDLQARGANKPHVFDVVPASAAVKSTIENHLAMIEAMQHWEQETGRTLHPDGGTCEDR